ncbi:MAG: glycosyltransferase [Burkholderiales bacterium]|nr:glycosyltransferase [Burkholderiales bacterium]MBH2016228.1 glycosyltransferase [Burkholderiales bacterium]
MPSTPHTSPAVLHVVDSLERGGLERLVHDLAIAQHRAGWTVLVFSILPTQGYRADLEAAGVPVIVGNKQGTLDVKLLSLLRRTLKEHRIDTVHAHNFVPSYHAAVASLFMRSKPALVITCHDMGTRLANRRLRTLFTWAVGRSQRVAMVGRQVFERFLRDGFVPASKAETVLNAVPIERFELTPERRNHARRTLGLRDDELVVGCVGRLVELKNHAALIRLWPEVLQRHPKARLVLIGDGPLRDTLSQQAQQAGVAERVLLAGLHPNVADLLPAFDLFALPSFTEGVSIALLEAAATGLPVLASAVGGNVEVVHDGVTGRLFDVQSDATLSAALFALLDDADTRRAMGSAGRNWVHQHASLDSLHQHYGRIYRDARALAGHTAPTQ